MPKLTPIHVGVEEEAVGRIMRLLHTMPGVGTVYIDYDHEKKKAASLNGSGQPRGPYKQRKHPVQLATTGEEEVAKALFGKPPMTRKQLVDIFTAQGRSPTSINSVLFSMRKAGDVVQKQDPPGSDVTYSLTKKVRDRMRHRKANKSKKK